MPKQVYVILAFHAHEPMWDLADYILSGLADDEMGCSVRSTNWVKRRAAEGRDVYASLVDFAKGLEAPVSLEASNELLTQLANVSPPTFERLKDAYRNGAIYPIYGNAHHSHVSLLSETELTEEIKLNQEFIHEVLGAPKPKYRGLFPSEDSLDASKLSGIRAAGIDFVLFPHLDRRKVRFRAAGAIDTTFGPFLIGDGLIALPRHFPVSQNIWRPITKMEPEKLTHQGYLLGEFWVLPEEYRQRRAVDFPVDYPTAVAEYRRTLEEAIESSPDGGLLLYVQDLELMDFGDVALKIVRDAWEQVRTDGRAKVRFVTPDRYLEEVVLGPDKKLGRVKFHQISWAPEIRLVLRSDGHYPPLGAGRFRGLDADRELFRRWPFVFWETGRYINDLVNWLLQALGFSLNLGMSAAELRRIDYRLADLPLPSRLALHSRLMKRACNWGWQPDEGRHKWPYLHAYAIAAELLAHLGAPEAARKLRQSALPPPHRALAGLARLPEIIVDTRVDYLRQGLTEQERSGQLSLAGAFAELEVALALRHQAIAHLDRMAAALQTIERKSDDFSVALAPFLNSMKAHCKAMFMAIDHIQRAWGLAPSVDDLVITMYRYLYELYPPKFPDILISTLPEAEAEASRRPKLR